MVASGRRYPHLFLLTDFVIGMPEDTRAIRAYETCGFVVEGRRRNHDFKQGRFRDLIFMGLCVDDPAAVEPIAGRAAEGADASPDSEVRGETYDRTCLVPTIDGTPS